MSVSRKNFLTYLKTVDYIRFKNINDNWKEIEKEANQYVKNYPEYFWTLVVDDTFDEWGDTGKELKNALELNKFYGYTPANTKHWKTTSNTPRLHMSWEQRINDQLPLVDPVSCPMLQDVGQICPWHIDRFLYYKNKYPGEEDNIVRFIVFMADWQLGHILQAGNSVVTHWKAGDVILWHPNRHHLSGNLGINSKWTCNITGILKEEIEYDIPALGADYELTFE